MFLYILYNHFFKLLFDISYLKGVGGGKGGKHQNQTFNISGFASSLIHQLKKNS